MARPLRVQYPGAIYHVTSRMLGDARSLLFRDDQDRERYLRQLEARVEEFEIRLFLFVLMRNHVHLVFETPRGNCSRFMHALSTAYTVYFNLRHGRHGHLLDGRFKSKLVESGAGGAAGGYLLSLTRYVHLNPGYIGSVRRRPLAERIQVVREHRWSSYPGYVGRSKPFAFVDSAPLLAVIGGRSQREQKRRYRDFVETGLAKTDDEFLAALSASPRSIGGDPFRHWVEGKHTELMRRHRRPEDVAFRHVAESLPPSLVLQLTADALDTQASAFRERRRTSPLRAVAASMLSRYGGLTQREIAEELQMGTGSAVSQQRQRLPALLKDDRALRKAVEGLEAELRGRIGTS